jgi:hypothetical protein
VLIAVNKSIQHPIEETGEWLRESMTAMKNRIKKKEELPHMRVC